MVQKYLRGVVNPHLVWSRANDASAVTCFHMPELGVGSDRRRTEPAPLQRCGGCLTARRLAASHCSTQSSALIVVNTRGRLPDALTQPSPVDPCLPTHIHLSYHSCLSTARRMRSRSTRVVHVCVTSFGSVAVAASTIKTPNNKTLHVALTTKFCLFRAFNMEGNVASTPFHKHPVTATRSRSALKQWLSNRA